MNYVTIIYFIVSILSIFLYIMSVQFKKKEHILLTQVGASMCYLIVYVIKGAWSGVCIEILEELKNIIFIKIEKKHKKIPIIILITFIILLLIVSIIFYDGILSLVPLLINILLFVSTYFKNPKYIRYTMVITGLLWGIYNIYVEAYIIFIGNILEIASALVAIKRYKKEI